MSQFEPLNHDGLLDLIPDGAEGYLGQKLVVGSDTLDLSRVPFTVEPEDGLTLEAGADVTDTALHVPTSYERIQVRDRV